jgi:putative restriction endonuclease
MFVDMDWELRLASFNHLNRLRGQTGGLVRDRDLQTGIEFRGERVPLFNKPVGIWRPRILGSDGAALSVTTTPPRPGKEPPYHDDIADDSGHLAYRYQRNGPDAWMNRAVRAAMEFGRPIIYFYGIEPGLYEAIYPVFVVGDDPASETFYLSRDELAALALGVGAEPHILETRRRYATREVKVRLHQRQFRSLVMRAYGGTCSVCSLRQDPLLDAAHILEDRDQRGRPEVPNGLSLCKIHHAAFDANILGISPDSMIHIRADILEEHDGPMLQHGLKEMDGGDLHLPRRPELRPNRDYLAERFERFSAA